MGTHLAAGYVTHTGYAISERDAASYNRITDEIVREQYPQTRLYLLDQRHQMFVSFCEKAPK
jgi:hypothetical protein